MIIKVYLKNDKPRLYEDKLHMVVIYISSLEVKSFTARVNSHLQLLGSDLFSNQRKLTFVCMGKMLSFSMNYNIRSFLSYLLADQLLVLSPVQGHQTPSHKFPLPSRLHQPSLILTLLSPLLLPCPMCLLS